MKNLGMYFFSDVNISLDVKKLRCIFFAEKIEFLEKWIFLLLFLRIVSAFY